MLQIFENCRKPVRGDVTDWPQPEEAKTFPEEAIAELRWLCELK